MFTRNLPALGFVLVLTAVPALAQDTATHNKQTELVKGSRITIEGCVAAGVEKDTFVLGTVVEHGGAPVETGRKRVYWLDSPKHVRDHVGKQVQITGEIRDLERSEIELNGSAASSSGAKIEGPGAGEVKTKPTTIGVGTAQARAEADIPITLVKINVESVKVTRTVCGGPATATAVRPPG
jgi:hypothetical protein